MTLEPSDTPNPQSLSVGEPDDLRTVAFPAAALSAIADRKELARHLLEVLGMDFEKGVALCCGGESVYLPEVQGFLRTHPIEVLEIAAAAMQRGLSDQTCGRSDAVAIARQVISEELPGILPALGKQVTEAHLATLAEIAGSVSSEWRESLFKFNLRAAVALHGEPVSPSDLQKYCEVLLVDYERLSHDSAELVPAQVVARNMQAIGEHPTPEKLSMQLREVSQLEGAIKDLGFEAYHLDYWILPWIGRENSKSGHPQPMSMFSERILGFARSLQGEGPTAMSGAVNVVLNCLPRTWDENDGFSYLKFHSALSTLSRSALVLSPYASDAVHWVLPALLEQGKIPIRDLPQYAEKLSRLHVFEAAGDPSVSESVVSHIYREIVPAVVREREASPMSPRLLEEYVSVMVEVGGAVHADSRFSGIMKIAGDDLTPQLYREIGDGFSRIQSMGQASCVTAALQYAVVGYGHRNSDDVDPCVDILVKLKTFEKFLQTGDVQIPVTAQPGFPEEWDAAQAVLRQYHAWSGTDHALD